QDKVKPAMDELAIEGYLMKGGEAMEFANKAADQKIKNKVKSWNLTEVKRIADLLEGEVVTLNSLPGKIRQISSRVNAYDLSTFMGLASGGGVKIKYYNDNFGLNVHYDTREQRSGRSFGVGP